MKNLPSYKASKGFTLIELLVVISIIAVLATIGISMFMGAQKNARDGKRLADLDGLVASLESGKDFTTTYYQNNLTVDYPNGVPTDPTPARLYCINLSTSTGGAALAAPADWTQTAPPACVAPYVTFNSSTTFTNIKSFKACAWKENPAGFVCRASGQ